MGSLFKGDRDEIPEEETLRQIVYELLENEKSLQRTIEEKNFETQNLRNCLKMSEAEISNLRKKIQSKAYFPKVSTDEIHNILPMLTKNQLSLMTGEKLRVNWTNEEVATGFALSYFSRRGYNYLIHKLLIPQPSVRTLQEWAQNMSVKPGILKDSLVVLKGLRETLTEGESQVVISYDEMKCKSLYEYSRTLDCIMGPHRYLQTVMVRGLFGKFKQPVYINFDHNITDDLLDSVIVQLHEVGYNVVGCVSDNGGGNVGLLKKYGVNFETTYILHPVTGRKIYMLSDAPHLMKLLRNWFIDGGFVLKDGTELNQGKIRELLKTNTEISPIYKLSVKHLEVEKAERQNVRLACELFSHSVAQSLRRNFPNDKEAAELSDFIELVNKWFDVMNSYSLNGIGYKKPYGLDLSEQNAILDEMYSTIKDMKCYNKKKKLLNFLQIFQKGILMSITSIKALFVEMHEKFDYQYILSHRLNQDCLENFYSQVRGRNGANDHPSPEECLSRIRTIILGKNPGISAHLHANTIDKVPDEYVSASFINLLSDDNLNNNSLVSPSTPKENEDVLFNEDCDVPLEFIQDQSDALSEEHLDDDSIDQHEQIEEHYLDEEHMDIEFIEQPQHIIEEYLDEEHLDLEFIDQPEHISQEYLYIEHLNVEILHEDVINNADITEEFIKDLSTPMTIDEAAIRTTRLMEDGLEYIAGWIAFKLKKQNPNFARSKREDLPSHISDHTYAVRTDMCSQSWIDSVSYGGLTKPSEKVLQWVKDLEEKFLQIHGTEFNSRENIQKDLVDTLLTERSHVPAEVVKLFARSRIHMRVKFLNKKRKEEAFLKRLMTKRERNLKRKNVENDDMMRAKVKKLKKTVL